MKARTETLLAGLGVAGLLLAPPGAKVLALPRPPPPGGEAYAP